MGWWPCGGCGGCACGFCAGETPQEIEIVLPAANGVVFDPCTCASWAGTFTMSILDTDPGNLPFSFETCCVWEALVYSDPDGGAGQCGDAYIRFGVTTTGTDRVFVQWFTDRTLGSGQDYDVWNVADVEWLDADCTLELDLTTATIIQTQGNNCNYASGISVTVTPL